MMIAASAVLDEAQPSATELERLRAALDVIDAGIVELIARRCRVARDIGAAKRQAGEPGIDLAREATVVRQGAALASSMGVQGEEVRTIFWQLIALGRRAQAEASS
jgi:chorismate mutase